MHPSVHSTNNGRYHHVGEVSGDSEREVSLGSLHKRKMQNFLPCKTSPQNHCDVTNGNGVIYEDLTNIRPRAMPNHCPPGQTAPSIEPGIQDPNIYTRNLRPRPSQSDTLAVTV
uniref:(California timema) hypothetical protein n=1 Tax=Timema californicum TaxID=61474 RepID=A0A7R9P3J1_TIMCA|nr:unnamed protein product [Timema californicum]